MGNQEDCTSSDCPACAGPFHGTTNTITKSDDWGDGFCADLTTTFVKNTANKGNTAITYYFVMKYCNTVLDGFWGAIDNRDPFTKTVTEGGKQVTYLYAMA